MAGVALRFAASFGEERYALLELDDGLLETILAGGVTVKGEDGDEACLCTPTCTYVMRMAESSNTQYLLPGTVGADDVPGVVAASVATYFELKPTVPRLVKLRRLLSKRKYDGFDDAAAPNSAADWGGAQDAKRLTTDALRSAVQCSDAQLDEALVAMHAVELQGEWRLLGITYRHQITEYVLKLIELHGWERERVRVADVLEQSAADFPDFAPQAVRHCLYALDTVSPPASTARALDAEGSVTLDERKVAVFHGENMLREQKRWRSDDFFAGWRAVAPEGVELELSMLRGIAVEVDGGTEQGDKQQLKHVQWLPPDSLPTGTKQRLTSLFNVKPVWTLDEMSVYLDDVLEHEVGRTAEQILIQHACQMKAANGETVFQQRV
ncbi:hypothetical protein KFE25_005892 [Diacronema lutheri]|uniref:Sister chromatid cohesion protein DCC1 n=2 Tax=Diacronema lutheri TaxID=2081491 RepID=A0A8J5XVL3_DIALT|nr:hypothetical protein KFE25_005892 [Diacronema lutheri]